MCGSATLTTVASSIAIALAPTVAASAIRPFAECSSRPAVATSAIAASLPTECCGAAPLRAVAARLGVSGRRRRETPAAALEPARDPFDPPDVVHGAFTRLLGIGVETLDG